MSLRTGAIALAVALIAASPAVTQDAAAQGTAAQPAAAAPAYQLNGFRSARFGMTERDVRAAIRKDFKVKDDDISSEQHPVERTTVLMVPVPDVLDGQGKAVVGYVFGYRSKALIQVSVTWSKATDPKLDGEKLVGTANILLRHLLEQGYQREGLVVNGVRPDGSVVIFRGHDTAGRAALLLLTGTAAEAEGQKSLTPEALQLSYFKDTANPDVFTLPKDAF